MKQGRYTIVQWIPCQKETIRASSFDEPFLSRSNKWGCSEYKSDGPKLILFDFEDILNESSEVLQKDLVWTHKWSFRGLSDLHLSKSKVTLKTLVKDLWPEVMNKNAEKILDVVEKTKKLRIYYNTDLFSFFYFRRRAQFFLVRYSAFPPKPSKLSLLEKQLSSMRNRFTSCLIAFHWAHWTKKPSLVWII